MVLRQDNHCKGGISRAALLCSGAVAMLLCGMLWTLLDALVLAGILTRPVKGIPSTAWKKHEDTNLSKAQKRCVCYILRHRKVCVNYKTHGHDKTKRCEELASALAAERDLVCELQERDAGFSPQLGATQGPELIIARGPREVSGLASQTLP
eukprot:s1350_g4.t1